eukprot:228228-Prymnesium_polylepis.1
MRTCVCQRRPAQDRGRREPRDRRARLMRHSSHIGGHSQRRRNKGAELTYSFTTTFQSPRRHSPRGGSRGLRGGAHS